MIMGLGNLPYKGRNALIDGARDEGFYVSWVDIMADEEMVFDVWKVFMDEYLSDEREMYYIFNDESDEFIAQAWDFDEASEKVIKLLKE